MIIADYTALIALIRKWSHRGNIEDEIPHFIALSESHFNRSLRVRQMEARYIYDASVGERYIRLPKDYLGMRNVQINSERERALEYLTPENIDRDFNSSSPGCPQAFTVIGQQMQIAPSPDAVYQFEIAYYQAIPSLSDQLPTNWLLEQHPDLYLQAALMQSAIYRRDAPLVEGYRSWVEDQLTQINKQDHKARWPQTPMRANPSMRTP